MITAEIRKTQRAARSNGKNKIQSKIDRRVTDSRELHAGTATRIGVHIWKKR